MTQAREKRLWVGLVAFLAPLPLPFSQVIAWPVLGLYWLACALYLRRAWRGAERWLPAWAMNLLALAYLPVLFVDLSLFWRGRLLQPLVHLALFTLLVKLFALKKEADKWHALLGAFFLFLAAMGSSVHPSIVLYQVGMLALWLFVMARLAGCHVAARSPVGERSAVPLAGFISAATLLTVLGAVPLFVLLPRFQQPYLVAPGVRSGSGQATGFTDRITLDTIGRVRSSSAVAFRFALDRTLQMAEFRFKEGTYDLFRDNVWRRGQRPSTYLRRSAEGWFRVAEGRPRAWMEIWLRRSSSARLALPVETLTLELPVQTVTLDDSGVTSLLSEPGGTFGFRAGLGYDAVSSWEVEGEGGPLASELDSSVVTPSMEELAARVMGDDGTLHERVRRLERHLQTAYRYTLDLGTQSTDRPIERFLFETRSGHCEYFATSMALLLRSQGIPARFVTGYYGADFNPLEGYFIVRLSNAHAWVEAWLPESGWTIFDPTPAAGLPEAESWTWTRWWSQAYDYLIFRWDRYVLTYGFTDQADFFFRFRDFLARFWSGLRDEPAGGAQAAAVAEDSSPPAESVSPSRFDPSVLSWLPMLLAVLLVAIWLWRARQGPSATATYSRLLGELERRRVRLTRATPPLEVERRAGRRWPEAAGDIGRVVGFYLRESFGGAALSPAELEELEEAMRAVRRILARRDKRGARA